MLLATGPLHRIALVMVGVLLLFLSASDGVFSKEQDLWRPGTSEEGTTCLAPGEGLLWGC